MDDRCLLQHGAAVLLTEINELPPAAAVFGILGALPPGWRVARALGSYLVKRADECLAIRARVGHQDYESLMINSLPSCAVDPSEERRDREPVVEARRAIRRRQ